MKLTTRVKSSSTDDVDLTIDPSIFPSCPTDEGTPFQGLPHFIPSDRIDLDVLLLYTRTLIDADARVNLGHYPSDDAVDGIWVASTKDVLLEDAKALIADTESWRDEQQKSSHVEDGNTGSPQTKSKAGSHRYACSLTWSRRLVTGRADRSLNPWPFIMRPRPNFLSHLEARLASTQPTLQSGISKSDFPGAGSSPSVSTDTSTSNRDFAESGPAIAEAATDRSNHDGVRDQHDTVQTEGTNQMTHASSAVAPQLVAEGGPEQPNGELYTSDEFATMENTQIGPILTRIEVPRGNYYGEINIHGHETRALLGDGNFYETHNHYHNQATQEDNAREPNNNSATRDMGMVVLGAGLFGAGSLTASAAAHTTSAATTLPAYSIESQLLQSVTESQRLLSSNHRGAGIDMQRSLAKATPAKGDVSATNPRVTHATQGSSTVAEETITDLPQYLSGEELRNDLGTLIPVSGASTHESTSASQDLQQLKERKASLGRALPPPKYVPMLKHSAMQEAVEAGQHAMVRAILESVPELNLEFSDGSTALTRAAKDRDSKMLSILLEGGADPDLKDLDGQSSVLIAIRQGDIEALEMLMLHGANPNQLVQQDKTAIDTAIDEGRCELIYCLMQHGARISSNPVSKSDVSEYKNRRDDISVPLLEPDSALIPTRNMLHSATSLLSLAIIAGHMPLFRVCLAAGVQIQHTVDSPLHEAIRCQQHECLEQLLQLGAKIDHIAVKVTRRPNPTNGPQTPIMVALDVADALSLDILIKMDSHGQYKNQAVARRVTVYYELNALTALDFVLEYRSDQFELAIILLRNGYGLHRRNRAILEKDQRLREYESSAVYVDSKPATFRGFRDIARVLTGADPPSR